MRRRNRGVAKKVSRDADLARLEDCDGRCGAVSEQMWIHRLTEGGASAVGDDAVNCFVGQRTALRATPETVVLSRSGIHRAHFAQVSLEEGCDPVRNRSLERRPRLGFRAREDHSPFIAHAPEMPANLYKREGSPAHRSQGQQPDHETIAKGDNICDLSFRASLLHQLLAQSRQARGGDDSGGQRSRLALTLEPRYQPREVLWHFAGKHDPDGVPQLCEKHMSSDRP